MSKSDAPSTLSARGRERWAKYCLQFSITDVSTLTTLESALVDLDRAEKADTVLRKEGLTCKGVAGRTLSHPLIAVARDCRASFARAMRQLDLTDEPPRKVGRPPYVVTDNGSPLKKIGGPND